jgi:hypothetical protein
MSFAYSIAVLVGIGGVSFAARASACATCGCGDPTLTALGFEKPYRDRIRVSIEARYRTDSIGTRDVDALSLREQRIDVQAAWAPHERIFLLVSVPFTRREVDYVNLARKVALGPGDSEFRAKFFLYQDDGATPRHLVATTLGVKAPTAPLQRNSEGLRLPMELQSGTGSVDPIIGLSYAYFPRPWSAYASTQAYFPTIGIGSGGSRPSATLRATVAVQYQLTPWLAPRLAIDARIDGTALESGVVARDSGGFIGFVSPEVLVSPMTDLTLYASARIPTVKALAGEHREGTIATLGIALDL